MVTQQPIITDAGKEALISSENDGLKLVLTHVGFGTSKFIPDGTETEALNEIKRVPIAGKMRLNPTAFQIMAVATADEGKEGWISSIYFYAGDVLFALHSSKDKSIFFLSENNTTTVNYALDVSSLPADQVEITIDPEAATSLKLIGEQAEIIKRELLIEMRAIISGKFKEIYERLIANEKTIVTIGSELEDVEDDLLGLSAFAIDLLINQATSEVKLDAKDSELELQIQVIRKDLQKHSLSSSTFNNHFQSELLILNKVLMKMLDKTENDSEIMGVTSVLIDQIIEQAKSHLAIVKQKAMIEIQVIDIGLIEFKAARHSEKISTLEDTEAKNSSSIEVLQTQQVGAKDDSYALASYYINLETRNQ